MLTTLDSSVVCCIVTASRRLGRQEARADQQPSDKFNVRANCQYEYLNGVYGMCVFKLCLGECRVYLTKLLMLSLIWQVNSKYNSFE